MSTFRLNGNDLWVDPTEAEWVGKSVLGISGKGNPIYPGVREFEMRWNLLSATGFSQLQYYYDLQNVTGTTVVDLPKYGIGGYSFYAYSGCVLHEPVAGAYFSEYVQSVVLRITLIR